MNEPLAPAIAAAEAAFAARRAHTARAAAAILPGPLRAAFAPGLRAGGLRPVCLGDLALLAGWRHPVAAWLEAWLAGQDPAPPALSEAGSQVISALCRVPWEDALSSAESSGTAYFSGCSRETLLTGAEACAWLVAGFGTMVQMRAPAEDGVVVESTVEMDGLGWWLRLYGFAVVHLRQSREEALAMPLAQLVALRVWHDREVSGLGFANPTYTQMEEERLEKAAAGAAGLADERVTNDAAAAVIQGGK